MRVKLDENIPLGVTGIFTDRGHDAVTVPQQGLGGASDTAVWQAAQREKRLLVTLDLDFADIRRFPPGEHEGLLILRPSRRGRKAIANLLQRVLAQHSLDSFRGGVVADERSIRVRRA